MVRHVIPPGARRIIIDGPSGSGKTTLAGQLSEQCGLPIFHLDDWYPGWEGLAQGTRIAEGLATGELTAYPRWDWEAGRVSELVPAHLENGWIIEGCGSLTATTLAAADHTIWVEADPEVARERALRRDGDAYLPWWDCWHQQELGHWKRWDPRSLADAVIRTG